MKAIQKELGEGDDQTKEVEELAEKIEAAGMPEPVKKEALRELDRLSKMPPAAAEYTVSRTYVDWLVALPWARRTEEVIDLPKTKSVPDAVVAMTESMRSRVAMLVRAGTRTERSMWVMTGSQKSDVRIQNAV